MNTQISVKDITSVLEEFQVIVGTGNVLTIRQDIEAYVTDWTGDYRTDALAVVRPATTREVAGIIMVCAANDIAVVPQGGRTGLCGGGVPVAGQPSVVVSLGRMNAVRAIDPAGRTVVAEAGVVLDTLHRKTLEHNLVFPLMFGARGSCTVGGNLSTNAGGSNVVRYGNTRELCLGIEAVMPDGSVVNALTGLRKDNTGYDLKDLLIGAEGTLGIITAAVFRLFPNPVTRTTAFLSVASIDAAIEVLNRLQDHTGGAVEAYEYMPRVMVDAICDAFPDIRHPLDGGVETGILLEVASSRPRDSDEMDDGSIRLRNEVMELFGDLMEGDLVLDAMVAQSEQQRADLWKMRESTLEAIMKSGSAYFLDISLPLQQISTFIREMDDVVLEFGFQPLTVGHLGDGNLHYTLVAGEGRDWDDLPLEDAKAVAFDLLVRLNGSFSAEHGIGQSKLPVMTRLKEAAQLEVMRAIKAALDPRNIMNPGKVVPAK